MVFKNGKFYVTDNDNKIYSFDLSDIQDLTLISNETNSINDLASCPVRIKKEPITGSV